MAKRKQQETALAKNKSSEIMAAGEFFDNESTGMEDLGREDLVIPFLRIAQKSTESADPVSESYIKGLKPGLFFNSASGKVYGKTPQVVVLGYFRNFVKWQGSGKSGIPVGSLSSTEFEKIKSTLGENDKGVPTDEDGLRYVDTRNFYVMLPDFAEDGIILFTCSSSAIKASKILNTGCRTLSIPGVVNVPIYAGVWQLTTAIHKNDDGSWFKLGGPDGKKIVGMGLVPKLFPGLTHMIKESFKIAQENIKNEVKLDYTQDKDVSSNNDDAEL